MEVTNRLEDGDQTMPEVGSGALLAKARKDSGKSIEEIADELNLSVSQIRTIEQDQSEGLPEPTYVRGYIRSYAKLLDLDAEEVLAHYLNKNWQKSTSLDDMPRQIGEGESEESSVFTPVRVFIFVILVGLLGYIWYAEKNNLFALNDNGAVNVVVEPANNSTQLESDAGALSAADGEGEESQGDTAKPIASTEDGSLDDVSKESTLNAALDQVNETSENAQDGSSERVIKLTFSEASWVDIRDESQNKLAYQSYPAGEELELAFAGELTILLGNASGVEVTLNDEEFDLAPYTQGVYAKFLVGQSE